MVQRQLNETPNDVIGAAVAPSPAVPFAPPAGLPVMPAPYSPDGSTDLSSRAEQLLALITGTVDVAEPVSIAVLTNRKIPRVRASIDRLIIAPSGIWVIDHLSGPNRVEVVAAPSSRSLFSRRSGPQLMVDGKNKTRLLRNSRSKTEAVVGALELLGKGGVPVHRVLCFVTADVANDGVEEVEGATIMSRARLDELIELPGRVASGTVDTLATQLACRFPQG